MLINNNSLQRDKFLTLVRSRQFWSSRNKDYDISKGVFITIQQVQKYFPYPLYDYKKELLAMVDAGELIIDSVEGKYKYFTYRALKKGKVDLMLIQKPKSAPLDDVTKRMREFLFDVSMKTGAPSSPWYNALIAYRDHRIDLFFRIDLFCGRVHTPITSMKGDHRTNLLLRGEEVCSIDVAQMQPQLLGRILREKIGDNEFSNWLDRGIDVYELLGKKTGTLDRNQGKKRFFMILFNKPNPKLAQLFGNSEWIKWVNQFKQTPLTANPHYQDKPHSNLSFLCQKLEVKLMRQIWQKHIECGIPFLTVHDEVIIRKSDADTSEQIFHSVLSKEFKCYRLNRK
jgi:hypothetical protein